MKRLISNHSKRFLSCLVAFSIVLATVFSAVSIKGIFAAADDAITYWDGNAATAFAGGNGTADNPFLIENGGQLYKAIKDLGKVNNKAAYYKITKDIYLNEGYTNYANWGTTPPANNWQSIYSSSEFVGHLDGDYHTIYGLYHKRTSFGAYFGFIPRINGGATISNLIISNSYVWNSGDGTGFFTGRIINGTVSNCVACNSAIGNSANDVIGGISGTITSASGKISNCATYNITLASSGSHGGILGKAWSGVCKVQNCFSAGNFPFEETGSISCSGTYTDISGSKNGVTVIQNSKMQGANALTNMKLSEDIWMATNSYPIIYKDLTAGLVWDGKTASTFAGGSGTVLDPYLIENGNQLYLAINSNGKKADGSAAYYLITEDIYLNKRHENYANWASVAPKNNWTPSRNDFIGHLDGDCHTVYGLYSKTGNWSNGLIAFLGTGATVSNLTVCNAYIHNTNNTAGGIAGSMKGKTTIKNCLVYNAVISASGNDVAGIVGSAQVNTATVTGCGTYNLTLSSSAVPGGILGRAWQNVSGSNGTRITSCFSVDNFPLGNTDKIWATNCFTNADGYKNGVTKLTKEEMQGTGAVAKLKLSGAAWKDTDSFPILRAVKYSGGNGTYESPYLIENADQLYRAIAELGIRKDSNPGYYLLTKDIYINEDYENYASWGANAPKNNWLPITTTDNFVGHLNGGGHTVYGLYVNKSVWCAGLIARVKGGSVRDLNLAKSYIHSGGGTVGGIVGMAYEKTNVSRCKVYDTVIVDKAGTDLGGVVGAAERSVMITGCASYNITPVSAGMVGGILGRAWSNAYIRESYSSGLYPLSINNDTYRVGFINVYTDTKGADKSGLTVLNTEDMKGENAFEKMPLQTSIWKTDSTGFPVFNEYVGGKAGEVWTGGIAENYAGGEGTEADPFLIETGEQLYKMVYENCIPGNVSKYYKVVADIRLNDTSDDKWYEKENVNMWHISKIYSFSFGGHLDGDGHTVSGIYTQSEEGNAYAGLIPVIDMGSSVKNIGVIESNINTASSVAENFTGGVVGWIDDWDSGKPDLVTKENIPVISGCFADETVTLSGMYCGGILAGVAAPVLIENCYFTGKFDNYSTAACMIGNIWTLGSKISHCYAATNKMYGFAGGQTVLKNELEYEACYNFGKGSGTNFYFVSLYDIRGDKAEETLKELDFENIWRTVEGGTPVLRVFGANADKFSYKKDVYSTVSFVTNATGMSIEPISGLIDSPIKLPTPKREGYNFAGWYVYSELQCEYTYDTFPFIDLILYAKWEPKEIAQDFENYPNTDYDLDSDYVYFRPGVENYDGGNVHGGNKAIKRLGNSSERQDFLVKYEQELTVGKEYTVSFWMMTETKGATGKVSMLHATWPDIAEPVKGDEITIAKYNNLSVGEWKQYKFKFTAKTPWVSFRTDGDTVLYFDDILVY